MTLLLTALFDIHLFSTAGTFVLLSCSVTHLWSIEAELARNTLENLAIILIIVLRLFAMMRYILAKAHVINSESSSLTDTMHVALASNLEIATTSITTHDRGLCQNSVQINGRIYCGNTRGE